MDERQIEQLVSELQQKNVKKYGLDKEVQRSGFIKFDSYQDKLKMMNTDLFLFGMKLGKHYGNIEFFDADFSNTIVV